VRFCFVLVCDEGRLADPRLFALLVSVVLTNGLLLCVRVYTAGGVYTDHQDIAIALGEVRSVYNEIAHGYTNGDILTDEYSDGETHYQSIPAEGEPVRTPVATPTKNAVLISGYGEDDDVEGPAYQDDADVAYGDATNSESASSSEDDTPADVYTDTDASGYSDNGAGYSENSSNDTGYSDNGRDGYTDNAPQTQQCAL
jgi:hypothetical protein